MAQYARVVLPVYVEVIFQHDLILRQRSGLVGAKDVYGAEVLDGIQVLDDGLLFAHGDGALGKAGGHNHGQHLRGKSHGNGDAEQECLQPVAFCNAVDEENQRDHDQHEADQHPGDGVDALGKAGFNRFSGHCGCHRTKQRIITDTNNDRCCTAGDNIAAHKGDVCIIGYAVFGRADIRRFFNGLAFSSQTCLTDKQIFCIQNSNISRNHIPGG